MCEFDTLYFGNDGYVARCKSCNHYQIAFVTTVLTVTQQQFNTLQKQVSHKFEYAVNSNDENAKNILIPTPCTQVQLCLTKAEVAAFNNMLQHADMETKTLALLSLFNK